MSPSRRGGGVSRRCECRGADGKLLAAACPQLAKKNHGKPQIHQELPARADGRRRRFRRTGYASVKDAQADVDRIRSILDLAGDDADAARRIGDLLEQIAETRAPLPEVAEVSRKLGVGVELDGKLTVGELLDKWAAGKKTRPNTTRGYLSHVRVHLKPHLGHLRVDRLNGDHITAMFDAIADQAEAIEAENAARREQEARCRSTVRGRPPASERARMAAEREKLDAMPPYRRTTGPMTRQRIRATLRAALNSPMARRHITHNPAQHLEMTQAKRPKATLWTDAHVQKWRETGEKPSAVMVWTPQQFGEFLDHAERDRLYPFFYLIAFRGLRRGEGVGQDWVNVDLDAGLLTVATEIVQDGWTPMETEPKTDGSAATIALDTATVQVLRDHRARQLAEREEAGDKWVDTGKVFTTELGKWLHPETVSDAFRRLYEEIGLPPINLRDLRNLAATLIHAGGGDLHSIKETLRHSTIVLTSDTYTSLLPEVDRAVAEAAAAVVPRARKQVWDVAADAVPE